MINYIRLGIAAGALAVAAAGGAAAAWAWQDNAWAAKLASAQTAHESTLGEIARAGAQQLRQQQELYVAQQARLQALDTAHYQEMQDAKAENESLRRDYSHADDERRRLRIAVKVARADAVVAGTLAESAASSLGDVATLELSGAAGQAVWDIRAGMIEDREKLLYLQGYASECKKQGGP
ncbi:hypothetical protein MFKK_25140 [Halopseudomonas aestusnigri]|uniref:lysis system i-spanin subunit Rz n=1 Tax=Halopseudomonas TaxID=2901189 RepID=UPI0022B6E3C7|nr:MULTISPECIES: lysis system i-spanin subunit Rz [Halopseudomonas]BDX19704.1 hypothetical protein MFKK_25140 [Halopseudomonas aestusnigri]